MIRSKLSTAASYRVGSTLKYRCERGFLLEMEDGSGEVARVMTRRCTTSGRWTGSTPSCKFVDCGQPEVPENGDVGLQNNGTYYGSVAFYKCDNHFNLDGKTSFQSPLISLVTSTTCLGDMSFCKCNAVLIMRLSFSLLVNTSCCSSMP